ncbi:MAG TPA: N-6 DNA methylase [Gemmatimonadaceae bacterium]|nr:N-6 DNA methylase [Gemmatimonadaceae bacterium]
MLPLRTAAARLAAATSLDGLAALAATLGFRGTPTPVALATLGLARDGSRCVVVRGRGLLRALLIETAAGEPLREQVARVARALARRSPHPLWCILATEGDGPGTVVATWSADRQPVRVVALSVDRRRLVDSDADTLRALHAAGAAESDVLAHAAWLDVLGREALSRRFYGELEGVVGALADALQARGARLAAGERRDLALVYASRLLFLSFLEAKGWLDGDRAFLAHAFERHDHETHRRLLRPLFFGTLNTPLRRRAAAARAFGRVPFLNGGLFAPTALERRAREAVFPDAALALVPDRLLARYRFTAREDAAAWSDAAVDPEMLGRAFECLMHGGARRASGAFYTPQSLVAHATGQALAAALAGDGLTDTDVRAALRDEPLPTPVAAALRERALRLRVLDPACGSGAFLVHALETLAELAGRADAASATTVRRTLLATGIFGVDVNPTAVWLCELRLWLSAVIDEEETDPLRVVPLPNLDRNIRVGDALAGGGLEVVASSAMIPAVARLRTRYASATGARKAAAARTLDRAERAAALRELDAQLAALAHRRRDLLGALRGADLFGERTRASREQRRALAALRADARQLRARRRRIVEGAGLPFTFASHFPDLAGRGFDVVLGNPPWVRPHRLPPRERHALHRRFAVARGAAWPEGARLAAAGTGFGGQVDLAALFVERALTLLRPHGTLVLLLPAKLWRALAGGGVRRLLAERARVLAVEDWSRAPALFDAAVYPSLLVARRDDDASRDDPLPGSPRRCVRVVEHGHGGSRAWSMPARELALGADPAAPWILAPADVRRAFTALAAAGRSLALGPAGRPLLGVKCGCNAAFLLRGAGERDVTRPMRLALGLEPQALRPVLRGETLTAWRTAPGDERIVWTHGEDGEPLPALPPGVRRWLEPWRARLQRRADNRAGAPWWALFRTAAAHHDRPRVVWADVARRPRAAVLPAGDRTVPLNSCYVARCANDGDALALAALLNAPLAAAWLALLAEPARGGYARHLAWTVALLPLPRDWPRARALLAPLAERAWGGEPPPDDELHAALLRAYGLDAALVAPLLAWARR